MVLSDTYKEVVGCIKHLYNMNSEDTRLLQVSTKELVRNSPCTMSTQKITHVLLRLRRAGALDDFNLKNQRRNQYAFVDDVWNSPIEKVYEKVGEMLKHNS